MELENRLAAEQEKARQYLEPTSAKTSPAQSARATVVPTASVTDEGVEQDGEQKRRGVDMEVWEASRRRVELQKIQQEDAFSRRSNRRSELDARDSERERAKRAMSRSPLEDFDVSYEGGQEAPPPQQQQQQQSQDQLAPRLGRAVGPGEQWAPQSWTPAPRR
jgi:hypothetical protein